MKKVTVIGTILIMLAVLAVPVMAKTPGNPNSVAANPGNGNSTVVSSGDKNQVREQEQEQQQTQDRNQEQDQQHNQDRNQEQEQQQTQDRNGNNGVRGNGNNGEKGNGNQAQSRMRSPFYLQGEISAIDPATQTITVTLTHGNAQVKQYIGETLALQFTDTTQIYKITQGNDEGSEMGEPGALNMGNPETEGSAEDGSNRVAIPFEQLAVGDRVAIHGNLLDGVFTATLVTVYVGMPAGEPVGDQG